jgi:hypothetical protein
MRYEKIGKLIGMGKGRISEVIEENDPFNQENQISKKCTSFQIREPNMKLVCC